MADESKNITVINKKDSGFPPYLDFDKLRAEGISYLGELSGKIWTDHNAHDPGITILEALCYALLDLGYRTNLPVGDLLARNPSDTSKDNNFFTPAEILSCNPLTIIDYRKLLIDIEGVKNAWLEPARDVTDICRRQRTQTEPQAHYDEAGNPLVSYIDVKDDISTPAEYLNGLYHIYIEPEKNFDTDFKDAEAAEKYAAGLKCRIKKALMAHRNLCEDFEDIYILCKFKTGVCADIELQPGADVERAYLSITEKLREFFSPSPQFYTLQQMLDQGKPMDEIFSGRPYNISESHGFTDSAQLQQIQLKKEIHLSDVYTTIAGAEGIKKVQRIKIKACGKDGNNVSGKWKFSLPKNHTAEFSPECSSFTFTVNGVPLVFDAAKYEDPLSGNFSHNGKLLYPSTSPYLNTEIPKGACRSDLDDYFSVQNDFPAVYGIQEGGLPDSASAERKAQALQLKGYLLFFDQLLCNYLAQIKNIRTLFSMSAADAGLQHTYFFNRPNAVSELDTLLRFPSGNGADSIFGSKGDTLLYPVSKKAVQDYLAQSPLPAFDPAAFGQYAFSSVTDLNIALGAIRESFSSSDAVPAYLNEDSTNIFYYLTTASDEVVLLSKSSFKTKASAAASMSGVTYMAGFDENYKSFITPAGDVSFFVESGMVSYEDYLQKIVEGRELYQQRRNGFLNHLLARFAEKFTDYALLSYGSIAADQAAAAEIKAKEDFLSNYDEISSNRGKAYDYLESDDPQNISGFEREVKYLSGIDVKEQHHLCNFIIDAYDEEFLVNLHIANHAFFSPEQKYTSRPEAQLAAQQLFRALADKANYSRSYDKYTDKHSIYVKAADGSTALLAQQYSTDILADEGIEKLSRMFSGEPNPADVFISKYVHQLVLSDHAGNILCRSADVFETDAAAKGNIKKLSTQINTPGRWNAAGTKPAVSGTLLINGKIGDATKLLNIDAFKIDINDTIVGKPDKFTYDVLDRENAFKLHPEGEFDNKKDAEVHCRKMLLLAADKGSFRIEKSDAENNYRVVVAGPDKNEAACYEEFRTEEEAVAMLNKVHALISQHEYSISTEAIPSRYKFNYHLGYAEGERFLFTSNTDYASAEESLKAAAAFNKSIPQLRLHQSNKKWQLSGARAKSVAGASMSEAEGAAHEISAAQSLVELQKGIENLSRNNKPEAFNYAVSVDHSNGPGRFVYRLVDKDNVPAYYTRAFRGRKEAEDAKAGVAAMMRHSSRYLQICLGGSDVVHKRTTAAGEVSWHYVISDRNESYRSGEYEGEEIVLLESVQGYDTPELAAQAFNENYLYILSLASDINNYGSLISLSEPADRKASSQSIAFVPSQTADEIAKIYQIPVGDWISKRASLYPIKQIEYASDEFNNLFCTNAVKPAGSCCDKSTARYRYYFELPAYKEGQWRSTKYYNTPEEAMKVFLYFLILLKFPGNIFIDCDNCAEREEQAGSFKICIREVLAESALRFENRDPLIAWGSEGVGRLICAVQSDAFRYQQRKEDCSYTFDINCGEDLIIHPCKYDTAQKRTDVLHLLHRELLQSLEKRSFSTEEEGGNLYLLNIDGERFAMQSMKDRQNEGECEARIKLVEDILTNDNVAREETGILYLLDKQSNIIVSSVAATGRPADEWKAMLNAFACHSPVVKATDKDGNNKYCIEIKLPSFTDCMEEGNDDPACGCGPVKEVGETVCGIAWKTACCFTDLSCDRVWQMYLYIIETLKNLSNYRPVYDCTCNSFGIAIDFSRAKISYNSDIKQLGAAGRNLTGGLVAFNPQHYPTPDMACKAAKRAKELVNAEGLYVAEHILLRPGTEEDCRCRPDAGKDICKCEGYVWKFPDDDPCRMIRDAWFILGADPYSFIATVALPAWPKRFSTPEAKAAMENILYRTAPAHVMLRILWLTPYDLCRFETKYRNLRRLLANKRVCIGSFDLCDFLTFLLHERFQEAEPCRDCLPCGQKETKDTGCFAEENRLNQAAHRYTFPEEVEAFFHRKLIDCGKHPQIHIDPVKEIVVAAEVKANTAPAAAKAAPAKVKAAPVKVFVAEPVKKEKHAPAAAYVSVAAFINRRLAAYRDTAADIAEKSKSNPIAVKAAAYLKDPSPSHDKTEVLITEIIQNKKPAGRGAAALTDNQQEDLIQSILCYRLDNICFKEKDMAQIKLMQPVFDRLLKAKIDAGAVYNHWNALGIKKYVSALNIKDTKKIITGR